MKYGQLPHMYSLKYWFDYQISAGIPKANPATTAPTPAVACAPAAADPSVDVAPLPEACDAADGVEVVVRMTVLEPETEVTVLVATVPVLFPPEALAALKSKPQSVIRDATSVGHPCQPLSKIEGEEHLVSAAAVQVLMTVECVPLSSPAVKPFCLAQAAQESNAGSALASPHTQSLNAESPSVLFSHLVERSIKLRQSERHAWGTSCSSISSAATMIARER